MKHYEEAASWSDTVFREIHQTGCDVMRESLTQNSNLYLLSVDVDNNALVLLDCCVLRERVVRTEDRVLHRSGRKLVTASKQKQICIF